MLEYKNKNNTKGDISILSFILPLSLNLFLFPFFYCTNILKSLSLLCVKMLDCIIFQMKSTV